MRDAPLLDGNPAFWWDVPSRCPHREGETFTTYLRRLAIHDGYMLPDGGEPGAVREREPGEDDD